MSTSVQITAIPKARIRVRSDQFAEMNLCTEQPHTVLRAFLAGSELAIVDFLYGFTTELNFCSYFFVFE